MVKALFICHGNICRSTMAEFYMKYIVNQVGLDDSIYIESAGTSREEIGNDTHYGTKQKLDEMGIPYTRRKARQVTMMIIIILIISSLWMKTMRGTYAVSLVMMLIIRCIRQCLLLVKA